MIVLHDSSPSDYKFAAQQIRALILDDLKVELIENDNVVGHAQKFVPANFTHLWSSWGPSNYQKLSHLKIPEADADIIYEILFRMTLELVGLVLRDLNRKGAVQPNDRELVQNFLKHFPGLNSINYIIKSMIPYFGQMVLDFFEDEDISKIVYGQHTYA